MTRAKTILCAVMFVFATFCENSRADTFGPAQDPRDAVVHVKVFPRGEEGSGWFIAPRLVATAAHVVADSDAFDVTLRDGRVLRGRVAYYDKASDFALISVDEASETGLPINCADTGAPGLGVVLMALGHTYRQRWLASWGRSTGARPTGWHGTDRLILNLGVNGGMSGGPVIDMRGRVVGLVSATYGVAAGNPYAPQFAPGPFSIIVTVKEVCKHLGAIQSAETETRHGGR